VVAQELPKATPDRFYRRVLSAVGVLLEVVPEAASEKVGTSVVADEGYFALEQIGQMQSFGMRTVIADPHARRRRKDLPEPERKALRRARAATRSGSGKALLRKRGEHLERGFAHVLDHGGLRRATLRGRENLTKRHMVAALMRRILSANAPGCTRRSGSRRWSWIG
jgi:transposase